MDEAEPLMLVLSSRKTEFPSWILIKQLILGCKVNSHKALTCYSWTMSLARDQFNAIKSCFWFWEEFHAEQQFGLTANNTTVRKSGMHFT